MDNNTRNVLIVFILALLIAGMGLLTLLTDYNLKMGKAYVENGYTIDTVKGTNQVYWVKPEAK